MSHDKNGYETNIKNIKIAMNLNEFKPISALLFSWVFEALFVYIIYNNISQSTTTETDTSSR